MAAQGGRQHVERLVLRQRFLEHPFNLHKVNYTSSVVSGCREREGETCIW